MKLGNLIAIITKYTGIKWLIKKIYKNKSKDCGCEDRKNTLNEISLW